MPVNVPLFIAELHIAAYSMSAQISFGDTQHIKSEGHGKSGLRGRERGQESRVMGHLEAQGEAAFTSCCGCG